MNTNVIGRHHQNDLYTWVVLLVLIGERMSEYIAHVTNNDLTDTWERPHGLSEHLLETAELAKDFAENIGSDWAEIAGQWHDLGKFRRRFQDYIRIQTEYEKENACIENGKRAPHSTAGAMHAVKHFPPGYGHVLAYIIAGHHAGLPDWFGGRGSLKHRLATGMAEYDDAIQEDIPKKILEGICPELPSLVSSSEHIALWIRMLFSCLVDADFLDTELYMSPKKSGQRSGELSVELLHERFAESMADMKLKSENSSINDLRNGVLSDCHKAALWGPGMFSLTVPTGGGKTLSSLAFALEHARKFNKSRIIYAIPFTSIIEQNAEVFRNFLGPDSVLEHHSSLDVDPTKENSKARLAAENWNAPLIVTTNVQLFESLHASRTSRCRKLHNIVNSVIVLDEAQQIPRDFQEPITRVMQQLSDHFGVTWVLCTATQPELKESVNNFGQVLLTGLNNVREIVSNPGALAKELKRVEVQLPAVDEPRMSWDDLSKELEREDCVLSIVNTRNNAKNLFQLLPDDGFKFHLSANMCAAHRSEVIKKIKDQLQARRQGESQALRVVSSQLIEAGVDVDFPVVYRAMAGLDSIAQSAGRCNREGKLNGLGKVVVFKPEQPSPPGFLKQGEDITTELIVSGGIGDPLSSESFEQYFSRLNLAGDRDKQDIAKLLSASSTQDAPLVIQFREAAKKFRLIDDVGVSVVVPFRPNGGGSSPVEGWIAQLEKDGSQKWIYKKLQRFTVSIPERVVNEFVAMGAIDTRAGLRVLHDWYYHLSWGVDAPDKIVAGEESVY